MKKSFLINSFIMVGFFAAANSLVNTYTMKPSEVELKKAPKIVKVEKKVLNLDKELLELDFTPRAEEKVLKIEAKTSKEEFLEVKKQIQLKTPKKLVQAKTIDSNKIADNSYELSMKEINEQAKIETKKVSLVNIADFKLNLNDYSNDKIKTDRISTIAAATDPATESSIKEPINNDVISQKETADELVFFDYSEDGKVNTTNAAAESTINEAMLKNIESPKVNYGISGVGKKPTSSPVTAQMPTVKKKAKETASNKVNSKKTISPQVVQTDQKDLGFTKGDKGNDYSNPAIRSAIASLINDDKEEDFSCLDSSKLKRKNLTSELVVTLDSVNYFGENFKKIHNFELRFLDDQDDIVQDAGDGKVNLKYKLTSQMNIRRGTLFNNTHYPTAVDFVFEGVKSNVSIPVFERETFESLIKSNDLNGLGAHLLVELDEKTEDVEIDVDTKYEAKFYLNDQLRAVDRSNSNYSYILFIGVTPGNTIVNFRNDKNEVSNKIIYLAEKEIYYDPNFYAEILSDEFELYKESLLSKCKGLLNIDKSEMESWSFESKVKKKSLNKYSMGRMIYPVGTRKYVELKHLEESIFVGRWSENSVVVPTESYVRHVLSNFDIHGNECLVQINLNKNVKHLSYGAYSKERTMRTQAKFLDKDGTFYSDVSDETSRIFLMGEEQGIINIKLEYTDGSSQFLQTYCSDNTYLVEQL